MEDMKPQLEGKAFIVRFADDFIIGVSNEKDANTIMEALPVRFNQYGLTIHPEKTKLVPFKRPKWSAEKPGDDSQSFSFLGFTHYWGKSLKGYWVVKRKTDSKKLRSKLKAITEWCKKNRHKPVKQQQETLTSKLRGHYQYYGINGNYRSLSNYLHEVKKTWRKWLNRRTRKGRMNWDAFNDFLKSFPLPNPKIAHSNV